MTSWTSYSSYSTTSYTTYGGDKDESTVTIESYNNDDDNNYNNNSNNDDEGEEDEQDDSNNQYQQPQYQQQAPQQRSSGRQAAAPVSGNDLVNGGLNKHNEFRQAYSIPNLTWDSELAAGAQKWAEHLAYNRGGALEHSEGGGENIAQIWEHDPKNQGGYFAQATYNWVDGTHNGASERQKYNAGHRFPGAGHYMQVMWRDTTHLGMGYAFVPNSEFPNYGRKVMVVGRYSPPGNVSGQDPY